MSPAGRVQAMQNTGRARPAGKSTCRARFCAQRLTRGLELDITSYLPSSYEHAVNNVNCSDNVGTVQNPLKSGVDLFEFGMGPL